MGILKGKARLFLYILYTSEITIYSTIHVYRNTTSCQKNLCDFCRMAL